MHFEEIVSRSVLRNFSLPMSKSNFEKLWLELNLKQSLLFEKFDAYVQVLNQSLPSTLKFGCGLCYYYIARLQTDVYSF